MNKCQRFSRFCECKVSTLFVTDQIFLTVFNDEFITRGVICCISICYCDTKQANNR